MAKAVSIIDNLLTEFKTDQSSQPSSTAATGPQPGINAATGYDKAQQAVYVVSEELPKDTPVVKGPDFNKSRSIDHILEAFRHTGFQASNLANAVDRINEMVSILSVHLTFHSIHSQ